MNTKEADSRNKILSLDREEENYLKASFRIVSHERDQNSLQLILRHKDACPVIIQTIQAFTFLSSCHIDKKFLSYKLEVVVVKTYITLTEVKNNSNQG